MVDGFASERVGRCCGERVVNDLVELQKQAKADSETQVLLIVGRNGFLIRPNISDKLLSDQATKIFFSDSF